MLWGLRQRRRPRRRSPQRSPTMFHTQHIFNNVTIVAWQAKLLHNCSRMVITLQQLRQLDSKLKIPMLKSDTLKAQRRRRDAYLTAKKRSLVSFGGQPQHHVRIELCRIGVQVRSPEIMFGGHLIMIEALVTAHSTPISVVHLWIIAQFLKETRGHHLSPLPIINDNLLRPDLSLQPQSVLDLHDTALLVLILRQDLM
jgi:hypothetical protein